MFWLCFLQEAACGLGGLGWFTGLNRVKRVRWRVFSGWWRDCQATQRRGPRRRDAVKSLRDSSASLRRLRRDCVSSARLFASMPFWCAKRPWAASLTKRTWWPMAIGARSGQGSRSSCEATAEGGLAFTASTPMAPRRQGMSAPKRPRNRTHSAQPRRSPEASPRKGSPNAPEKHARNTHFPPFFATSADHAITLGL